MKEKSQIHVAVGRSLQSLDAHLGEPAFHLHAFQPRSSFLFRFRSLTSSTRYKVFEFLGTSCSIIISSNPNSLFVVGGLVTMLKLNMLLLMHSYARANARHVRYSHVCEYLTSIELKLKLALHSGINTWHKRDDAPLQRSYS